MFKRLILPALLIAGMASLPALASDRSPEFKYTHSERIHKSDEPKPLAFSALEAGLPQSWCGTKSTSDQTVNSSSNDQPKFKFFYVRASDQADRFSSVANVLQKSISTVHSFLLNVSDGKRTASLDLGTSCGPLYADITAVTLPGTLSSYHDAMGEIKIDQTFNTLESVAQAMGGPPRHYVFLLDQFESPSYISGIGSMALDDSPGEGNYNNKPGAVAYVATPQGSIEQSVNDEIPRALLHEMSHTIGAVQASAPNSTSAGHCTDGLDIMCYSDGSPEASGYSESVCTPGSFAGMNYTYDCNNNDYFKANPSSGSYLANNWNVYNSKYLLRCEVADPFCTSVPSSDPSSDNPAARTVRNDLLLYKRGKLVKKIGTVSATGAPEPAAAFVRNAVKMSSVRLPKGTWSVKLCFRELGESAVCETTRKKLSRTGGISVPRIYVTTSKGSGTAWGTVTIKAVSGKNRRNRVEVRTTKSTLKYSLDF